jgi:phosphatidylglycerophosphate synthase
VSWRQSLWRRPRRDLHKSTRGGPVVLSGSAGPLIADVLTASRLGVALLFVAGAPSPRTAVLLMAWAWASDGLDGGIARTAGVRGRLASFDRPVDAAVAAAVVWYLGELGPLPVMLTRVGVVSLLGLWVVTRVLAVQMLLVALAYGTFLWWAFITEPAPGRWLLAVVVLVMLATSWRRLWSESVPAFVDGWLEILTWRRRRPSRR